MMDFKMVFKQICSLSLLVFLTSSCAIWPYETDFECPAQEGLKCKSLYEVSIMAEKGEFGPGAKEKKEKFEKGSQGDKSELNRDGINKRLKKKNNCSCCRSKIGR
jgi:hypothetical protein